MPRSRHIIGTPDNIAARLAMASRSETKYCNACGAVGVSCCENGKQRQETANILARLVDRQSREISRLQMRLSEAREVLSDLKGRAK